VAEALASHRRGCQAENCIDSRYEWCVLPRGSTRRGALGLSVETGRIQPDSPWPDRCSIPRLRPTSPATKDQGDQGTEDGLRAGQCARLWREYAGQDERTPELCEPAHRRWRSPSFGNGIGRLFACLIGRCRVTTVVLLSPGGLTVKNPSEQGTENAARQSLAGDRGGTAARGSVVRRRGHRAQRQPAPVLRGVAMDVTGTEHAADGGENDGEQGFH